MRVQVALALPLLLGACGGTSYVEPTKGPRARVRFATASSDLAILRSYGDSQCRTHGREMLRLRVGALMGADTQRLGLPLWDFHENAATEVQVDASRAFHGMFRSIWQPVTGPRCWVPFSVSFSPDRDYEVLFDDRSCTVVVSELAPSGYSSARIPVAYWQNNNEGCTAAVKVAPH